MIKNIIFDVYGTLINTGTGSVDATQKIFGKYNLDISSKDIYRRWKELHKIYMRKDGEFITEREIFITDLKQLFLELNINEDPETEVRPMLESLLNRKLYVDVEESMNDIIEKYVTAIGSTTDSVPLFSNIKNTVLEKIPYIFTSESLKVYKPKGEFYKKILDEMNWNAEETLFVGDSIEEDIIGPQKNGLKTILINRRNITDKSILSIPDRVITEMNELLKAIELIDGLEKM